MPDELIGKQVGNYEVLDRIGHGGMATVYRARQNSMNRNVALKILPRHYLRDDTYLRRFEREVEIVAQLEHRNIVPVYDYGEHDGQPYIAMRHMTAGSVDDLLSQGPVPVDRAVSIIEQIAPALDYAHSKNVLHRDLKPSNILLDEDGGAFLTDFGIARLMGMEDKGTTITTQGVVGTPSYMSPEQAQGKPLDGRSDLYSMGITLFEMLTGRRPFENDTPYGIAVMQVTTPAPSPRVYNPQLTAAIEQVVLKALKKHAENRYGKAIELSQAFKLAVERPDSVHDTEPSGVSTDMARDMTQPSQAQQYNNERTVPTAAQSAPAQNVPPQRSATPPPYTPAPAYNRVVQSSGHMRPAPTGQNLSRWGIRDRMRGKKKKRSSNIWVSVLLGMVIGCSLLSVLVVALIMTLQDIFDDPATTTGAEAAITQTVPASLPTLDPTSQAARQSVLPNLIQTEIEGTPIFSDATAIPTRTPTPQVDPVGARPAATLNPALGESPGTIIFFDDREQENIYNIYEYDLTTGRERRLTDADFNTSYPMVSADGTRMVYQADEGGDYDIYVMDLETLSATNLTENDIDDRLPAWSPDSAWIVYSSDTRGDGTYDLYRVRADGSEREVIYSNGQRNSHARFNSDGQQLVFTSGEANDANTWEIMRFDLATGAVVALTDNNLRDSSPSFSPDDLTILYATDGEGGAALATMQADTGDNKTIIYDGAGYEWGNNYSPDGAFIVFNEVLEAQGVLNLMDVNGGDPQLIENDGGFYPTWRQ